MCTVMGEMSTERIYRTCDRCAPHFPQSIASEHGARLLSNFLRIAARHRDDDVAATLAPPEGTTAAATAPTDFPSSFRNTEREG